MRARLWRTAGGLILTWAALMTSATAQPPPPGFIPHTPGTPEYAVALLRSHMARAPMRAELQDAGSTLVLVQAEEEPGRIAPVHQQAPVLLDELGAPGECLTATTTLSLGERRWWLADASGTPAALTLSIDGKAIAWRWDAAASCLRPHPLASPGCGATRTPGRALTTLSFTPGTPQRRTVTLPVHIAEEDPGEMTLSLLHEDGQLELEVTHSDGTVWVTDSVEATGSSGSVEVLEHADGSVSMRFDQRRGEELKEDEGATTTHVTQHVVQLWSPQEGEFIEVSRQDIEFTEMLTPLESTSEDIRAFECVFLQGDELDEKSLYFSRTLESSSGRYDDCLRGEADCLPCTQTTRASADEFFWSLLGPAGEVVLWGVMESKEDEQERGPGCPP